MTYKEIGFISGHSELENEHQVNDGPEVGLQDQRHDQEENDERLDPQLQAFVQANFVLSVHCLLQDFKKSTYFMSLEHRYSFVVSFVRLNQIFLLIVPVQIFCSAIKFNTEFCCMENSQGNFQRYKVSKSLLGILIFF